MSNNMNPSIQTLPVEILHHIFDNLDVETILFSIRPVCRLFRAMVNTYDRFALDFKSMSKSNFHLFCHLIKPQNVISLRFNDDEQTPNQLGLFISMYHLRQFTRLHSITFLAIDEFQLNMILKRINLNLLTSFSLNIRQYDNRRKKATLSLLSSILAKSNLRKLELNIRHDRMSNLSWPLNSRIQHLIINSEINFDHIFTILAGCPQLHTLILKENLSNSTINMKGMCSFPQITSLTIEQSNLTIDQFESFLLLMPSLIYLKFISRLSAFDGKRCEQFIQINLPYLNNFEFFMGGYKATRQTQEDLELIINSFRSPFWVEHKKWSVGCQSNSSQPNRFEIYSIPICKSVHQYNFDSEYISVFNSTMLLNNDSLTMKNIDELVISLKSSTYENIKKEKLTSINCMFPTVTKLHVNIDRDFPVDSLKSFTSVIDMSKLLEVKLESIYFNKNNQSVLFEMISLLEQSYSLSSLVIHSDCVKYKLYPYLNRILPIIPRQIKRLQIPINHIEQVEVILERCQNLSFVQFEIAYLKFSQEVARWFNENTIDSIFRRHGRCDFIWIGQKTNHVKENHKRIKLNENELDS